MRVVQVITNGHAVYGAQKIVLDLTTRLRGDGDEVLVVVGRPGALTERFDADGIPWRHLPELQRDVAPLRDLRALWRLEEILVDFDPDLVASHSSKAGFLARLACYRLGIPNVFSAHGWSFEDGVPWPKRWVFLALEWLAGRISDAVVAVSPRGEELALRYGIVPRERLSMIPIGCPDLGARAPRPPPEVPTLTMVAEFRSQKDHPTLLRALAGLRDRPWELHLLGDGPLMRETQELAATCEISDRVHFLGLVDDVPSYLARTDLMVLATWWEGLPISIMEGLSMGLPVLASDVSGVRQQVLHDHNGMVVPPGDVRGLARRARLLLDEPDRLARYAARSRPHYLEQFTFERTYERVRALYEERVSARAPRC